MHHNHRFIRDATLAGWFYNGETIEQVVKILNSIMMRDTSVSTRFEHVELGRYESTFDRTIVENIDTGLPIMVGWDTADYGCHAVLVTGYWIGKEKWLTIRDPGGSEEISWVSLGTAKGEREIPNRIVQEASRTEAAKVRDGERRACRVPVDVQTRVR